MPRSRPERSRPARSSGKRPSPRQKTKPAKRIPRLTEADAAQWYQGKSFTFDWTSWHFPNWIKLLAPLRQRSLRVMEIGSWEGRSALFFLNFFPRAKLTCIDTFEGGQEHQEVAVKTDDDARVLRGVEPRFEANTSEFKDRIEKIKARSADALAELGLHKRRFDLAYIDGSHRAVDVYTDGVLTWPLIAPGGIVIFDDYQWDEMPKPLDNPKPGIDAFLKTIEGQYRLALNSYQIAIVKT